MHTFRVFPLRISLKQLKEQFWEIHSYLSVLASGIPIFLHPYEGSPLLQLRATPFDVLIRLPWITQWQIKNSWVPIYSISRAHCLWLKPIFIKIADDRIEWNHPTYKEKWWTLLVKWVYNLSYTCPWSFENFKHLRDYSISFKDLVSLQFEKQNNKSDSTRPKWPVQMVKLGHFNQVGLIMAQTHYNWVGL